MIKVDVISGFLGAGKTTFIRKLLKEYVHDTVVLIENEFGEIGIDGELVQRDGIEVYEISSGCICCIMKKDFEGLVGKVMNTIEPERIVIEPTGISMLSDIIEILGKDAFRDKLKINSLITVVDAVNYFEQVEIFGEFFDDQIANASSLVLSKTQLVEAEELKDIKLSLKKRNRKAEIIDVPWDRLTIYEEGNLLTGMTEEAFEAVFEPGYRPCGDNQFKTYAFISNFRFSESEVHEALEALCAPEAGKIIRGKGFLKGTRGGYEFSYVNGHYTINWVDEDVNGRICFIGTEINEGRVSDLFRNDSKGLFKCLTS